MSAHVLRLEWDGSFPRHTIVCNEPPEALCRAQFTCDCEEYAAVGIGDDGLPWHELTDGYLTDDERDLREAGVMTRHRGQHGGECTYALWHNEGDCIDELGRGMADVPITSFSWVGDGYEWTVGPTDEPAARDATRLRNETRDRLDTLDDAATETALTRLLTDAPDLTRQLLRAAADLDIDAVRDALNETGN